MNELKTIFISHSNPEDNYFAGWLTTKLLLLGYEVWCDVEDLGGGADSWKVIDATIRNKSIRFLFVVSSTSIHKDGTLKELAVADKIRGRGDFIIPLRLDATQYNQFPPEIIRLKAIDFSVNWADGLNEILTLLEKSAIYRRQEADSAIVPFWYKTVGVGCTEPIDKAEQYLSNWFSLELPEKLHVHVPEGLSAIDTSTLRFSAVLDQGLLISFAEAKSLDSVPIAKTETIYTEDFIANPTYKLSDESWVISGTRPKIVQLLNDALCRFMRSKGLKEYVFSGNRHAFYFDVTYPVRKLAGLRRLSLVGFRKEYNWHYAIEGASFLYPQPTYTITHHVVFSRGDTPVAIPRLQHSLRRSLGKDWYNRRWRDLMLTAILSLANEGESVIDIPVCNHQVIQMNALPLALVSSKGYKEPVKIEANDEASADISSGT